MFENEEIGIDEIEEDSREKIQKINNQLKSKMNMIDLLKEIDEKFSLISKSWIDNNDNNYDFLSNSSYPFEKSFDEFLFDFNDWICDSIKELNNELNKF